MATIVRVACVDCGTQELRPVDLQLFTTPNLYESRYAFTCPQCRAWINRPAPPALVADLRQLRVPECRQAPKELFEKHQGPPVSADEVLDFVLELRVVDELVRFAGRP